MFSSLINNVAPPIIYLIYFVILWFISWLFLHLSQKKIQDKEENQTARVVVGSISALYSIFLGFVMYILWNNYHRVTEFINAEASKLYVINESIKEFPPETQKIIRENLSLYVDSVLHLELPAMSRGIESPETQKISNNLYSSLQKIRPKDRVGYIYLNHSVTALNQVVEFRNNRLNMMYVSIPKAWYAIVFVGSFLIISIYSLETDQKGRHFLLILSAFLACFLTAVTILSYPFSGYTKVSDKPLVKVSTIIESSK